MTSSLVGSEMCIRDRDETTQEPVSNSTRERLARAKRTYLAASVAKRPVSYTHLTLPTICSV
eukprot:6866375-Prorocentrum_lima.AAC.1